MKSKIAFVLCALLCALSVPVFADNYLYFGGNYSNTIADGNVSHGIGGNFSAIGDYGGAKKVYAAVGFTADVSGERDLNTDDLKKLGVNGIETSFYTVPLRIGYPFMLGVSDTTHCLIVPSLAFDLHFFHADFTQKIVVYDSVYKVNYDISGWGYSLGASLDIGMQHKINKVYLRYGVDFDMRLLTILLADAEYSGFVSGTSTDAAFDTVADYFMLTSSPYVCVGFKL